MEQLKRRLTINIGSYKYSALDAQNREIRLVSVVPGVFDDEVRCKVIITSVDSHSPFEALSYSWGSSADTKPILIDDDVFQVTITLHSALRRLRKKSEPRLIWIDQISINQVDDEEKSHQVNMVSEIYSAAERVIVWLGDDEETEEHGFTGTPLTIEEAEPDENSRTGYHLREEVSYQQIRDRVVAGDALSPWEKVGAAVDLLHQLAGNKHSPEIPYFTKTSEDGWKIFEVVLEGLEILMGRPWWNRIWVVQETILARKVVMVSGSNVFAWAVLFDAQQNWSWHAMSCCKKSSGSIPAIQDEVIKKLFDPVIEVEWATSLRRAGAYPILWAVHSFRTRAATDDRDKIFGLLGLVNDWRGSTPLRSDYSLNKVQVYARYVKHCIQSFQTVNFLIGYRMGKQGSPSWIPDFTQPPGHELGLHMMLYTAGSWPTNAQIHGDRLLSVSGIRIESISAIGDVFTSLQYCDSAVRLQEWRELALIDLEPDRAYAGGGTCQDAFARTVSGDLFVTSAEAEMYGNLNKSWRSSAFWNAGLQLVKFHLRKFFLNRRNDPPGWRDSNIRRAVQEDWEMFPQWFSRMKVIKPNHADEADPTSDPSWGFIMVVGLRCMNQRFFLTKNGFMGVGPVDMEIGDEVWVLRGGTVPFVLRLSNDAEILGSDSKSISLRCFRVVGDCYVHGIMDGEAIQKWVDQMEVIWLV